MEAALGALAGTGLTDTEKLSVLLLLTSLVVAVGFTLALRLPAPDAE